MRLHVRAEGALERPALRPLVVHLAGARDHAAVAGRTLIGEHHLVHAVQQRRQDHDRRVDRGDRDMPVPCALAVVLEQLRRQRAADVERRQAGTGRAGGDQLRTADPGDGLVDARATQRLDADQRILAAADGDQRMLAQSGRGRRCRRLRRNREAHATVQAQAIAIRKLAQAVHVDLLHQHRGGGIDGIAVDADLVRHRRLVVTDAGDQVQ